MCRIVRIILGYFELWQNFKTIGPVVSDKSHRRHTSKFFFSIFGVYVKPQILRKVNFFFILFYYNGLLLNKPKKQLIRETIYRNLRLFNVSIVYLPERSIRRQRSDRKPVMDELFAQLKRMPSPIFAKEKRLRWRCPQSVTDHSSLRDWLQNNMLSSCVSNWVITLPPLAIPFRNWLKICSSSKKIPTLYIPLKYP